mmetsp:Transcript_26/g.26  ORF Transcript_26/g.26 Transcript_26/m.26 type:complete len:475 (-) Transcript_26:57-1481(-)
MPPENLPRKLYTVEKAMIYTNVILYDTNFFNHLFNHELLLSAIKAAMHREPLLCVNYFDREGGLQFEKVSTANVEPEYIQSEDENSWKKFIDSDNTKKFATGVDQPLFKFFVFESKVRTALVLKFDHLIGDYYSVKTFIHNVLKYYSSFCRGEPYDPNHEDNKTLPMPLDETMLEDWNSPENIKRIEDFAQRKIQLFKDFSLDIPFKPIPNINNVLAEKGYYFEYVQGSQSNLSKNLQVCKDKKLSLSMVSSAASLISAAMFSAKRTGKLKHLMNFDFSRDCRRVFNKNQNRIMNFSEFLSIDRIPVDLTKNLTQITSEVKTAFNDYNKDYFLYINSLPTIMNNLEKSGLKEILEKNHNFKTNTFCGLLGKTILPSEYDLGQSKKLEILNSIFCSFSSEPIMTPYVLFYNYLKNANYTIAGHHDEFNKKITQRHLLNFSYLIESFHENSEVRLIDLMPKIEKLDLDSYKEQLRF